MTKAVLVTGGSGFVGAHTILQLLQKEFTVHTTLRSLSRKESVLSSLLAAGAKDLERLHFYEADLTSDAGWEEAMQGVTYVLHVASPFPASNPSDENELIVPARDGSLRVLKAAEKAGVKRVVLTSSFAAIGYSIDPKGHVFTEDDWTDTNAPLPAYIKSKTLAEKAAWDFIQRSNSNLELTVINPVGIFGPMIGDISSASLDIAVAGILNGTTTESPDFTMGVVDVRDVAAIHILAMENANAAGERFIACADGVMSFYDVAELFKKERPQLSQHIVQMQPTPRAFYIEMTNQKARHMLGWQPGSKEEALLSSADSLLAIG